MPQTMEALRKLAFELRLWLCAELLNWAFDAVPRRGHNETAPVWIAINDAAQKLAKVTYKKAGEQ